MGAMGWLADISGYIAIWNTFQAEDPDNHEEFATYRVEDICKICYDDVIRHLRQHFVADDPLCEITRLTQDDEQAMAELAQFWRLCLQKRRSVVCYKEYSDEIIGVDLLYVRHIAKKELWNTMEFQSQKIKDMIELLESMTDPFSTFMRHNVDRYLTSYGFAVKRRYRGLGIGTQILKTRKLICRDYELELSAHNFTSIGSQRTATSTGYRRDLEVSYDDFVKKRPSYVSPRLRAHSLNLMSLTVNLSENIADI